MTISATARMALTQWSSESDSPSRSQFEASFAAIDALAAIDLSGTFSSRPAAGTSGRYYYATDNGIVYRDNGTAWEPLLGSAAVGTSGSRVSNPSQGQLQYDTNTGQLVVNNSGTWEPPIPTLFKHYNGAAVTGYVGGPWFQSETVVFTCSSSGTRITYPVAYTTSSIPVICAGDIANSAYNQVAFSPNATGFTVFALDTANGTVLNSGNARCNYIVAGI